MRAARVFLLVLLSLPGALWSQEHGDQYHDSISWGPNKETFRVTLTSRRAEGTFLVSESGFRWFLLGGVDTGTGPLPWQDIRTWSCARPGRLTINGADINLKREDLLKVVNQYLKKFAPASIEPEKGCSPESF